ncbi:MAG TPA: SDR family oxidoreductase [Naasia sp.]
MFPDLAGELVVVTGAGGGQGAAEAEWLVRAGCTVIAGDLEPPSIAGATGVALDVSDEEAWSRLTDSLRAGGRAVHGLVNNAGITRRARVLSVTTADLLEAYSVNTVGSALGIRHLSPLMVDGSSIVNVGSAAALIGHYAVAYSASKWALRGLTKAAAMELGPSGIRVNCIHPGFIETPMTRSAPDSFRDANLRGTPLGRTGTSEDDIAPVVGFLLSRASGFITGVDLPVDGGLTSHGGGKAIADALAD